MSLLRAAVIVGATFLSRSCARGIPFDFAQHRPAAMGYWGKEGCWLDSGRIILGQQNLPRPR